MKLKELIFIAVILMPFAIAGFGYDNPRLPKVTSDTPVIVSSSSSSSSSGGGNPFNQILNTTSTVTFNHLNLPNRSYSNVSDFYYMIPTQLTIGEGTTILWWNRTGTGTYLNISPEYGYLTHGARNFTVQKTGWWVFSVDVCNQHTTASESGLPTTLTGYITRNGSTSSPVWGGYFYVTLNPSYGLTDICQHMQGVKYVRAGEDIQVRLVYSDNGGGSSATIYQAGTQFRGRYLYT